MPPRRRPDWKAFRVTEAGSRWPRTSPGRKGIETPAIAGRRMEIGDDGSRVHRPGVERRPWRRPRFYEQEAGNGFRWCGRLAGREDSTPSRGVMTPASSPGSARPDANRFSRMAGSGSRTPRTRVRRALSRRYRARTPQSPRYAGRYAALRDGRAPAAPPARLNPGRRPTGRQSAREAGNGFRDGSRTPQSPRYAGRWPRPRSRPPPPRRCGRIRPRR